MANILDLFSGGKEEKEIDRTLTRLEKDKTPVRVEIEGENIRFFTVLSRRRGLVVVAKPPGLRAEIKRDRFVRFKVPDDQKKEVRLEVSVPHFNLVGGGSVFLCKVPKKFAPPSKRTADRYNTSRFNNLNLLIPALKKQFRVVDISKSGCKVFLPQHGNADFKAGREFSPAAITVGQKLSIDLAGVVSRSVRPPTVGFQLKIGANGSIRYLDQFIQTLEKEEKDNLGTRNA